WTRVPLLNELKIDPGAAYLHFTSNETIHGVEYAVAPSRPFPDGGPNDGIPLVCDMSSDFIWRKFDVSKFALLYAGAQKNIGPSGLAVVVAKKEFIAGGRKDIPKLLQYRVHAENNS